MMTRSLVMIENVFTCLPPKLILGTGFPKWYKELKFAVRVTNTLMKLRGCISRTALSASGGEKFTWPRDGPRGCELVGLSFEWHFLSHRKWIKVRPCGLRKVEPLGTKFVAGNFLFQVKCARILPQALWPKFLACLHIRIHRQAGVWGHVNCRNEYEDLPRHFYKLTAVSRAVKSCSVLKIQFATKGIFVFNYAYAIRRNQKPLFKIFREARP